MDNAVDHGREGGEGMMETDNMSKPLAPAGVDDVERGPAINNLGALYTNQGELQEAEEMFQQVLKEYEKTSRLNHPSTMHVIFNLSILYREQDKLQEAEKMFQQALSEFEKA